MNNIEEKQNFFKKILVNWLGFLSFLLPLAFCFFTYDSAQVKITLFNIGALGAFVIFLGSLIYKKESLFTRKNILVFLPLIVYALFEICSYFFKPYLIARLDDFVREILYFSLFTVVCFGLKEEDFKKILKYIFAGAWLVCIYGIVQLLNCDFLPWKKFFGDRVFSTLANPNFFGSYLVFISVLILFSFLIKLKKHLIALFVLVIVNLIFTESKGAWLSFAGVVFLGSLITVIFTDIFKKHRKKILIFSLILAIFTGIFVVNYSIKRMQSVSFRLSTWRATWDMIEAKPLTGTGLGSFEIIYPAYKRPEIFYIENMHNISSQHAENYYLEQMATLGLLGFGLFIWVFLYILKNLLAKLKIFAKEDKEKFLLLTGFSLASASIYIHNLVDVSIYFVSTGFFLILFNGIICNLIFAPSPKKSLAERKVNLLLTKIFCFISSLVAIGICLYIFKDLWQNFFVSNQKYFLQIFYCLSIMFISIAILFTFIRVIIKIKSIKFCILAAISSLICLMFWFQFMGGVYFSRATSFASKERYEALAFYTKALSYNPLFYAVRQYRGQMLLRRFSLIERKDLQAGDTKQSSNDFKRALNDFEEVKKIVPNNTLLHYHLGSLYLKYANSRELGQREQYYLKAEENLKRAMLLDPVYDNIYFQLANIELSKGNKAGAIAWVQAYLDGPKEVLNQDYLNKHKEDQKAQRVLEDLKRG